MTNRRPILPEAVLRTTPPQEIDGEERAFFRMGGEVLRGHGESRRGHIERRKSGTAEDAARRPRAGQFDEPIEPAVRPEAGDAGAAGHAAVPEEPVSVEARAVWRATVERRREKALVREQAGAKVVGVDRIARRIGGEEAPIVRPRHRIGDSEFARRQLAHLAVAVDAVDRAAVAGHGPGRAVW